MREATASEFQAAILRIPVPMVRRMPSQRTMTTTYADRGTEVAERVTIYKRNKPERTMYRVNPDYLGAEEA